MSTVEELLEFPTYDTLPIPQKGGGDIQLKLLTEVVTTDEEAIIIVDYKPANPTTTSLTDFVNNSGLAIKNVIALNGNAVAKSLKKPSEANDLTPFLFIMPTGKTVTDNKTVLKVQMLFITLFHHLLFLAHVNKTSDIPNFNRPLEDKFTKLQAALNKNTDTSTVFGKSAKELKEFFNKMRTTYNYFGKVQYEDMMKYMVDTPKEIMDFFRGELATEASAPPAGAASPAGAGAATTSTNIVPYRGGPAINANDFSDTLSVGSIFGGPPLSLMTARQPRGSDSKQGDGDGGDGDGDGDNDSSDNSNPSTRRGFNNMSLPSATTRSGSSAASRASGAAAASRASGTAGTAAASRAAGSSAPIPPAGLRQRSVITGVDNDISVGRDLSVPSSNPRGRSASARASPPPEPSVARSNSSTTQPSRRSIRQAVQGERPNPATRRVSIRRNHQRVNFNPDSPPSAAAALAAGEVLEASNIASVSTVSLNQPSRIRLPQTTYPSGESLPPISTAALHQGLSTEEAVQRSRRRPVGTSPQAARNEADRLSDEVRSGHSKRD